MRRLSRRPVPRVAGFAARPGHAGRDRHDGARRLPRHALRSHGGEIGVLPAGRQVHRPHRRTGRATRRLRGSTHVRRLPAAAVPARAAGRTPPGAVHRLGRASTGRRRTAVVPPLRGRADRSSRRAALDRAAAELELHVRGLSLDEPAEELRRRLEQLCDELERDQRGLRILPRTGVRACAARGRRKGAAGLTVALDERRGATWTIDPATGNAQRSPPRTTARELDVCAQCHSRRGQFSNTYQPRGAVSRSLSAGGARDGPLSSGRSAARRGL